MAFHRRGVSTRSEDARQQDLISFYNLRASEEVCLKTPKEPP